MSVKLLTSAEAAELLGVKEHTLRVWRTTKRYPLTYTKIGARVMYDPADVQAFIDARKVAM